MNQTEHFYIVGIGASAGGLEALEQFFQALPDDSGMAFVIIQHLSPDYKSMMAEILSKYTAMPVRQAAEGIQVQRNHVYLIPPKKSITISDDCLRLTDKSRQSGLVLPIDTFFHSLASNSKDKAIAVILSGTGSDGTHGIRSIKEQDGMVVAQSRESAKFDGMPQSAIGTGLADFILPPQDMPEALLKFILHPVISVDKQEFVAPANTHDPITQILTLLKEFVNVDFGQYKPATVLRRIERRAGIRQCRDVVEYLKLLQESDGERKILFKELLIGVTKFFRNPNTFEVLRQTVIPQLFATKPADETLRIWVAGCSTGEEAYSLAILLAEYCEQVDISHEVKIFATDIDTEALQFAANAEYPESTVMDVSSARLSRFFDKRGDNTYALNAKIRKKVVFAQHDLTKNPPFNKLDLVSCRNLFIYLQPAVQEQILHLFHFALKQHGYLLLGESESISDGAALFTCENKSHKIYRARSGIATNLPRWRDLAMTTQPHLAQQHASTIIPVLSGKGISRQAHDYFQRLLLDKYLPPCLLINDNLDVLFISKRSMPYLEMYGTPDYNLLHMVPERLAAYARTAVSNALKHQKKVVYKTSLDKQGDSLQRLNLHVEPLPDKYTGGAMLLLEFEQTAPLPDEELTFEVSADARQHLDEMEKELSYTRETLQATIEELETSNEELQATNEELLAANEELQSTNEELQAVNEELVTVNTEYQHKIHELEELNETVDNLLRSSRIGTVFLDRELRIRRFTPAIRDEIHLLDSDIGRPFKDIHHFLNHPNLLRDLNAVMEQNQERDLEVEGEGGNWYLLQITPYLTLDGEVEGCAFSLVNITDRKQAEQQLSDARERLQLAVETGGVGIWELDLATNALIWDDTMFTLYDVKPADFSNVYDAWRSRVHPADLPAAEADLMQVINAHRTQFAHNFRIVLPSGQIRHIHAHAKLRFNAAGEPLSLLGVNWDETQEFETTRILQATQRIGQIGGWELDATDMTSVWTEEIYRIYDLEPGTPTDAESGINFYHPQDRPRIREAVTACIEQGTPFDLECRLISAKGRELWVRTMGEAVYANGKVVKLRGLFQDISASKQTEIALRQAKEAAEAASHAKSAFLANMSHELRTPLNAIMGFAQLLESDSKNLPSVRDKAHVIKHSGTHLLTLINDILDLSKIEAGKLELDVDEMNLQVFFAEIVHMFELRARQKELTFTYHQSVAEEVDSGQGFPLMIKADERRLRQLLLNLLSNAVKFTEHGHISLRVIYQNTVMRVEIEDSGCGISAAEQQIIFEPFKQLGAQKQAEGTGLGLSISQRLSDLMGGTLSARSTPGQGSMFWFEMPLTVIQWQQDMPPHIEMPIANRRITGHTGECQRILVVDDIASNRELLIEMLKPLGFEIAEAEDGKEALLVAEVFVPHVVIIDLRMPEMDGIECVKRLRSQPLYQDTVIFMLSASVQEIHKKDCLTAGCNAFLEKPLHLDTLLNSLEQHCQLQWIDANDSTVTETAHVTFPKEVQQRLQGFLEQGKVQEIINYLEQLDAPEMQPGKNKALDLAKRFELNKLKILLDFSS